jgi:2-succinyl-5-enolpyruvyl-6-hydroxy-3-cyclohexene-1-carboxylate synthase
LEVTIHLDERSAAFFALGLAKATRTATALACTSGTAAANYLPAVCEASQACVSMILLTADRPPELRFSGAPQTMDQRNLYGGFVRGFHELPLPGLAIEGLRALRDLVLGAMKEACAPPAGPVHIDVPFADPLTPAPVDAEAVRTAWERWRSEATSDEPQMMVTGFERDSLQSVIPRLRAAQRPWIVAGPESVLAVEREGVLALARAWGAPVLADIASGLRFRAGDATEICAHADGIARAIGPEDSAPDVVLRLGGLPTSKGLNDMLARRGVEVFAVQEDDRRRDPDGIVRSVIRGRAGDVCSRIAQAIDDRRGTGAPWPTRFARAERAARSLIEKGPVPLEAAAVRCAVGSMPPRSTLFFSNSMPIRWADTYVASSDAGHEVFVNRGVNGIDGITSTALGAAFGTKAPLLLVTGDLAFLHDLGGLRACRWIEAPVAILLLNNDGGGIFAHLPIARFPDLSASLFETPHGCDLEPVAQIFGLEYARAETPEGVADSVASTVASGAKRVIEVRTHRDRMAREHTEAMRGVVAEVVRAWS